MAFPTALILLLACGAATAETTMAGMEVNPIRKVVTMLQMMQNKVTEEGKKAEELFEAHTNCPRKSIPNFEAFYYGFNSLLLALCSFHIYWTYLIFLTLWRKLAVGRIKDSREFGDSDSD